MIFFFNFISVAQQVNDPIICMVSHIVLKAISVPFRGPDAGMLDFLKENMILSKLY